MRRAALVLALLVLAAPAARAEADAGLDDPRVREADALLGDRSGFGRAIELYHEALADRPDAAAVRQRLARVLAWSERYEESVAEYDRLLAGPEPPPDARVERAEVLSWSGRLDEAADAFGALLEADPGNARAARGLARTHAWSGRSGAADRAYARALELEEDSEARAEWQRLRAEHPPSARSEFRFFEDSDDLTRWGVFTDGSLTLDLDTRVSLRAGMLDVRQPRPDLVGILESDRAWQGGVAVKRRWDERLETEVELGARAWERGPTWLRARGRLQYIGPSQTVLAASLDHGDFFERSDSLAAAETGIRDTAAMLSAWRRFGERYEGFLALDGSLLSDSNRRGHAGASLSWRPWRRHELHLHVSGDVLAYTASSPLYYDPALDASGEIGVTHRTALPGRLRLELQAGAGYGFARQDGLSGHGPAYRLAAALSWTLGRWRFSVDGARAQSQRERRYVAHRAQASIGLDF